MVSKIPNDIFQFSTASALMAGLATHGPSAGQLSGYGSHGIGTFTRMNGELLFMDGIAWQMTRDGKVRKAPSEINLPFVQATKFIPEYQTRIPFSFRKAQLPELFERAAGPDAGGKNSFIPFVVKGKFKSLNLRIAGPQTDPNQNLAEVAENARKWSLEDVEGAMFGIISPEWSQGMSVGGIHCHFMTDHVEGKDREGGHVLDFETLQDAEVQWAVTGRYHLGLPRGEQWESLDLTADSAGLSKAEG